MAFLDFPNVHIAGISAGVPEKIVHNDGNVVSSTEYGAEDFVKTTGVRTRRVDPRLTTSDLCLPAAERLIADLNWDKSEIDVVVFVRKRRIISCPPPLVFFKTSSA